MMLLLPVSNRCERQLHSGLLWLLFNHHYADALPNNITIYYIYCNIIIIHTFSLLSLVVAVAVGYVQPIMVVVWLVCSFSPFSLLRQKQQIFCCSSLAVFNSN